MLILRSAQGRFDSLLADIRGVLQSELFDDELSVAVELLKKAHLRAAAVAGVVLERHLRDACRSRSVVSRKKDPTIGEMNDALKDAALLDVPTWRWLQRLADIRNLRVYSKDREPTRDEVAELLAGVTKAIATIP